jgi:hypothetical protein
MGSKGKSSISWRRAATSTVMRVAMSMFEGAVFLVVDPLPADGAHAAEGDFAGEDEAAGDLVLGALDLVVVEVAS